jgi:hypothetical protein
MVYWIREFENTQTGERFRVCSQAVDVPSLRREVAKHLNDQDWLDDQIYMYDGVLDTKLDGEHPLTIDPVPS